ncbi:MAG TPA: mechanosensitive ion channel family protein [Candidatus Sulfopaludibacter sp.]|nr:mechanosensitive ion channel family protein [Candidatus Sulfopaludibacter sp.]
METLHHILVRDPMALAWPSVVFLATFGAGWVARRLVMSGLRAWSGRTQSRPAIILTDALRGPILIWAVILGVHLALQSSELPSKVTAFGARLLLVLWIVSLTIMFMRLAGNLVRHYGDQVSGALPVTSLSKALAQLLVVLLGILVLLHNLGFAIAPILGALGVGGLAVALALQDTLSNLFAGFYIAVARQIRLADYIKLNTGEEGYVADITWRSTAIRSLGNNMIIIPNSKLSQAIVTNYYLPEKRLAASLQVGVSCDADPDRVERLLAEVARQAAAEIPGMLPAPEPSAAFDPGFGESSLVFTLNFHVAEFARQFSVRNELRKRLLRRFREEGIEMPYPTRTVLLAGRDGAEPMVGPAQSAGSGAPPVAGKIP